MRRPMERVAAPLRLMGADILHPGRAPAGTGARHARAARDRVRTAGRQRAGEVRDPAGGAARARLHARHRACALARSHRAHAAQPSASGCSRAGPRLPSRAVRRSGGAAWQVPADFSSAAFFVVAACLAAQRAGAHPQRGHQPDAHRAARDPPGHGRGHPRACPRRPQAAEPRADLEVRSSPLRGIEVPAGAGAARRSMSFRCSSWRPPARAGRPWCAGRRSCASRRAIGSRPWPRGSPCSASRTGCCRMACGCAAPAASAAAPSTAAGIIASRWPSRWRRCGPARRSRSWTWPMSRPPSRASWSTARAAGLQIRLA